MSQVIPNPKAPNESTDYIYGERMEPYEDRMNFFLNEEVDIKKTNVKNGNEAKVDGLESIIQRFSSYGSIKLSDSFGELSNEVSGLESTANRVKGILDIIIQAAKDAVDFLLNFINNRIARISSRAYRTSMHRKRDGIKQGEIPYSAGMRRLFVPLKVSKDPNWVISSLQDVSQFYRGTIKAYKYLNECIGKTDSGMSLKNSIDKTLSGVASEMGMSNTTDGYSSDVLPGVRVFHIDTNVDDARMYFASAPIDVKLPSPTYVSAGVTMDKILSVVDSIVKDIKSNQSTLSQLSRNFEKAVRRYESNSAVSLTPDERAYYNWIIKFNKRLMNSSIQYVIGSLDVALDFVNSGINR